MDSFFERLGVRAATIDEVLSDDFEVLSGSKDAADLAALRLASWCRASANGDWSLFSSRLKRSSLEWSDVLARFSTLRRNPARAYPVWLQDALWIEPSLRSIGHTAGLQDGGLPVAFQDLFLELAEEAHSRLWYGVDPAVHDLLAPTAHCCIRRRLLQLLSDLAAPTLFGWFEKLRRNRAGDESPSADDGTLYGAFVAKMTRGGGFREVFEDSPVLLRLIAVVTRQWIETWREFALRLHADMDALRRDILHSDVPARVTSISGGLSDLHNGGRSVHVVMFEGGGRVVYKPKDLRLDVAWNSLISGLNETGAPISLRSAKAVAMEGYGWTEFVEHSGCNSDDECERFFERSGAWLALLHCFGGTDFHQENMIAAGEHPVPIDLETILQPTSSRPSSGDVEALAYEAAIEIISNSVCTVGLLPGLIKLSNDEVLAIGGMVRYRNTASKLTWENVNSDAMAPAKEVTDRNESPNLPHIDGEYATLEGHRHAFMTGFRDYAHFLISTRRGGLLPDPFADFVGLPIRRVLRATSFYYGLIHRLRNSDSMADGITWSAQADFVARFTNWDHESESTWKLQDAERAALLQLNVPYFVTRTDGHEIIGMDGPVVGTHLVSGIDRARDRLEKLENDLEWQLRVVQENIGMLSRQTAALASRTFPEARSTKNDASTRRAVVIAEANRIASELTGYAIRRGPAAAWLGLDQRHSEFGRFVALGPDMYNGNCGLGVFFAAHASVTGDPASKDLALAAVAHLRKNLQSRNAPRMVRLLGIGGAAGLGSIIYGLGSMAKCLGDADLLADASAAARLVTDEAIVMDKRLDLMHGSAGAILGLLSVYRQNASSELLERAIRCGDHLLSRSRKVGPFRSWIAQGLGGERPLNGMSHGAAGFAYAFASLAASADSARFRDTAEEAIAYENSSFDHKHCNWPDWRETVSDPWRSQWCHGATGVGLSRIATIGLGILNEDALRRDVENALVAAERTWPNSTDTMCCGTLGNIEFFRAAGRTLSRPSLEVLASERLHEVISSAAQGDGYRWYGNQKSFNVGMFLGLAGVGYTCLRELDPSLPNTLLWG
ncbi:type 2 lantipeptide synthetase LanM [Rhizobium laguerreae]|uniref:type 2 lanthipeptide synthetase LanM family protein n=1 Tax=Rhizobium laguerreae TaxID=1076926 RepID=UPI001C9011F1|nr:type 2 lanthipeptide synthetase LanM family protein [Rhizobium laguerreae]MBY3151376.1 type 2 lantipeptide synthetase LanM [Rhizobium laguerreae]